VKTKFGTMLLASASLMMRVATAEAQAAPEPAAPPTPPAPAQPEPTPPPPVDATSPGQNSAAPPPSGGPVTVWGAQQPTADKVEEEPKPKPNPFTFSRFTWNNSTSTKLVGVGGLFQGSEDAIYAMDFGFNLRYAFLNQDIQKAFVNAEFGVTKELTDSDSTTKKYQPLFRDLNLSAGYTRVVYESADKETKTSPIGGIAVVLPTSLASSNQARILATGLSAGVVHHQKLGGSKATWFPDVTVFGIASWSHLFSRYTTPYKEDLNRVRQTLSGTSTLSGDLLPIPFAHDTVRLGLTYFLGIYKDALSFGNTWRIAVPFRYDFSSTCVQISTGCAPIDKTSNPVVSITTFDASLSYAIPQNLGRFDIGYVNEIRQLGENGLRQNPIYSSQFQSEAQFYVNLVAYFDGIYDKSANALGKKQSPATTKRQIAELPRYNGLRF
jgi:hypothetical protein